MTRTPTQDSYVRASLEAQDHSSGISGQPAEPVPGSPKPDLVEALTDEAASLAEQAKHHGRDWAVWWQGSGERGDHIMEMAQDGLTYSRELAFLGADHHDEAGRLVAEHNEQVRRLREVIGRQAAAKTLVQSELGRIRAMIPASLLYDTNGDMVEAVASTFREFVKVAVEATALRKQVAALSASQTPAPAAGQGAGWQPIETARDGGVREALEWIESIATHNGYQARQCLRSDIVARGVQIAAKLRAALSAPGSAGPGEFRIGRKVPRNVYRGDLPLFMAATDEDAASLVELLNAGLRATPSTAQEPGTGDTGEHLISEAPTDGTEILGRVGSGWRVVWKIEGGWVYCLTPSFAGWCSPKSFRRLPTPATTAETPVPAEGAR